MSTQSQRNCAALREYMHRDDNLLDRLRMDWKWDDEEFRTLVGMATRCLEEIEDDEVIPRYVASFFGSWLHIIKGMMTRPDFLADNRAGRSEQETKAYFAKRIEIIYKLVSWMSNGKRLHPPEHFILPEWANPTSP